MARPSATSERPLHWVGSSKKDLLAFPGEVVDDLGYALSVVQHGGLPPSAKSWKGEGPGVFELVADRGLTQARAAKLFGIPQPHISELKHYKLNRFSSERLLRFVTLLDRDVEIIIRPKAEGHASGVVSVSFA